MRGHNVAITGKSRLRAELPKAASSICALLQRRHESARPADPERFIREIESEAAAEGLKPLQTS